MKYRLFCLLLIIVPLQAYEPDQIHQHLPYNHHAIQTQNPFNLRAELCRLSKKRRKRELKLKKNRKHSWIDLVIKGAFLGVCGLLTWKNRYEIVAALLGGEIFLRKHIMVGGLPCQGREVSLSERVVLKQVPVARQSGPTCGYHASLRAMQLIDALKNGDRNLENELVNARCIENLIQAGETSEQDGYWRKLIKIYRQRQAAIGFGCAAHTDDTWLDDGAIQAIIGDEARYHRITHANFDGNSVSVCANPSLLGRTDGFDDVIPAVRARLLGPDYPFIHGFVLGNMQQHDDYGGSDGHWIAVVLRQRDRNNKEYIVADSCNGLIWRGNYGVRRLLQALEGRDVAESFDKNAA
ncbi:MAG: hypothetical protein Q8Q25_00280 [bacterium]|nr:hypothetical protein [bacterium]